MSDGKIGEERRAWMMIRVTRKTHEMFSELHTRREHGRVRGQVVCEHEHVTQDDVVSYLLKVELSLQARRRRASRQKVTRQTVDSIRSDYGVTSYTPGSDQKNSGQGDEDARRK